jgi:hypothetical protein
MNGKCRNHKSLIVVDLTGRIQGVMKMPAKFICAITATILLLSGSVAAVAEDGTTVKKTPGHEMQQKGSYKNEPGASGYSPGHEMQRRGSAKGEPGASGYAPGR